MESITAALSRISNSTAPRYAAPVARPPGSRWLPGDLGLPACSQCRGLGYVRLALPTNHPDFGKMFICQCAEGESAARMSDRLRAASALEPADFDLRWPSYRVTEANKPAADAVRATMARGWGWAYVWGVPGNGKTRLIKTAVAEAVAANNGAVYVTWAGLLGHIREGIGAGDMEERIERWTSIGILAVDEFGRVKETEWNQEVASRIFTARYEQAVYRKTVTLFASNFAPENSADWLDDRIYDGRFYCVEIGGGSLRPAMR